MPKLLGVYEYRFVAPGDVRADDLVIDDNGPAEHQGWRQRAMLFKDYAADLRRFAAERRAGKKGPDTPEELERQAAMLDDAAPSAERTVCVRRKVL